MGARVAAADLERSFEAILHWRCLGCWVALELAPCDLRVGTGRAPRCERCGAFMAPVSGAPPSRWN